MTLVSSPAGFGKSTLLGEWARSSPSEDLGAAISDVKAAWFSLDEGDNAVTRFLAYLVAALRLAPGMPADLGAGAVGMLEGPQPVPVETILTSLINDLTSISQKVILVLDDYHRLDSPPVDDLLGFLIEHLPPQLHIAIATRDDPQIPLARLRALDQVTELRAADLRFDLAEASIFLNGVMGLKLSEDEIGALDRRTEGWVAGLQLAAISLQGREDRKELIKSFSGSHRLVLDYLIEEVLDQQPEEIRSFLLQTSVLSRFTGPLCDAITGIKGGQETLERLDHANLFIVPLDEERQWYRYHHLFADLLRQDLKKSMPAQHAILHDRASVWFEQEGLIEEAIEHALSAGLSERAASLIENAADSLWARGADANLWRWLSKLPRELVLSKPSLCIYQAWAHFLNGQHDEVDRFLQASEQTIGSGMDTAVDKGSLSRRSFGPVDTPTVLGRAATIRAWTASLRHDVNSTIRYSTQALEYLPGRDTNWRCAAAISLGDAHALIGQMPAAYQARVEALKACEDTGNVFLHMAVSVRLAMDLMEQGELHQVGKLCQDQLRFATKNGMSKSALTGWLSAIWAEAQAEMNELDRALDTVEQGITLADRGGGAVIICWSRLSLIRVLFTNRELDRAEETVLKVKTISQESNLPAWVLKRIATWQIRIWLAQGKVEEAARWMNERSLELHKIPSYLTGLEFIGLARVLIAQGNWMDSVALLDRLIEPAQSGQLVTREIEMRILKALAFHSGGKTESALDSLGRALCLGEPRGFFRIFLDEGPSMASLLEEALKQGLASKYVPQLLAAYPSGQAREEGEPMPDQADLVEPLSERELDVLRRLAEGLTNREIADRLYLSVNTVKAHNQNIYGKIGVNNRTQAVARARKLGILHPH